MRSDDGARPLLDCPYNPLGIGCQAPLHPPLQNTACAGWQGARGGKCVRPRLNSRLSAKAPRTALAARSTTTAFQARGMATDVDRREEGARFGETMAGPRSRGVVVSRCACCDASSARTATNANRNAIRLQSTK